MAFGFTPPPTGPSQVAAQNLGVTPEQLAAAQRAANGLPSERVPQQFNTIDLIREFEGFRETPYWDVNAFRAGYGSDTITDAQGNVRRVSQGDSVTQDMADIDLQRRVSQEFEPIVARAVGADAFANMNPSQRAALTSIAYNYGKIPQRLIGAIQSGDPTAVSTAIRGLGGDNDGINSGRRNREADIYLGNGVQAPLPTQQQPQRAGVQPRPPVGQPEATQAPTFQDKLGGVGSALMSLDGGGMEGLSNVLDNKDFREQFRRRRGLTI